MTGVGGIIRDIFSMGRARSRSWTRSGSVPSTTRARSTCSKASPGISGYGNAVGVLTVGGEVVFDDCYREPARQRAVPGLLPHDRLVLARASRGEPAVLLGSSTGRDGIGGASVLASAGFGGRRGEAALRARATRSRRRSSSRRASLLDAGLAVGVQDLGAAGLSCAASETAASRRGNGRRRGACFVASLA